jgi:L-asparaginase
MKKNLFKGVAILPIALALAITTGCATNTEAQSTAVSATTGATTVVSTPAPEKKQAKKKLPTVAILATGGTIAGTGAEGKSTNYKPGQLNVEALAEAAKLSDVANVHGEQICNINSDDITSEIWLQIANRINKLAKDSSVSGFVITHGTDTLDETAYFLNLVLKTDKPVVVTGSMRPSTAISADGPLNLHQSVALASNPSAKGKGVMAVISDRIYGARDIRKINTFNVNAFNSGDYGCMGYVIDDNVLFYSQPVKKHTVNTEFNVSNLKTLPKVAVLYFNVDTDGSIIDYYAQKGYKGIVIAGAGSGEYSVSWKEAIARHPEMIVVRSTRVGSGYVSASDDYDIANVLRCDDLQPQKAAVLLRLALTKTSKKAEIQKIFDKY